MKLASTRRAQPREKAPEGAFSTTMTVLPRTTTLITEPTDILQLSVRNPTSRERWKPVRKQNLSDTQQARAGWNVLGPNLELGYLSRDERNELVSLLDIPKKHQTPTEAMTEASLLSRCGRWSCAGYDVDVPDEERSADYARKIMGAELELFGATLREAWSGPSGKRHLDWGTAEVAHPDLLRAQFARAQYVLDRAGFRPRDKARKEWVYPGHEDLEGYVDLAPLNHGNANRQRLWRPLGGVHKDGRTRKRCVPGATLAPSPITLEQIERGMEIWRKISPEKAFQRHAKPRVKRVYTPLEVREGLKLPSKWLGKYYRQGSNHDLRMALSSVAINYSILSRRDWVAVMGASLGDVEDARSAWDSTAIRIRQQQPCRGLKWIRENYGPGFLADLCKAIACVAGVTVTSVSRRLMVATADEHEVSGATPVLAAGDELDARLAKRLQRAPACSKWRQTATCTHSFCQKVRHCTIRRCGVREVCLACATAHARDLIEPLYGSWPEKIRVSQNVYGSRAKCLRERRRVLSQMPAGKRSLALVSPVVGDPGRWRLTFFHGAGCGWAAFSFLNGRCVDLPRERALEEAWELLMAKTLEMSRLLRSQRHAEAAAFAREIYNKQDAPGHEFAGLEWLSQSRLNVERKQAMDEKYRADDSACECPVDVYPAQYEYEHIPTGYVIKCRHPFPRQLLDLERDRVRNGPVPGVLARRLE